MGEDVGPSQWVNVSQRMITAFADATGDHQWIHVDEARAAQGPYGRTIAHGYLILSLIPTLLNDVLVVDLPGTRLNYGVNRVRFITPVPEGHAIRLGVVVASVEVADRGWHIVLDATIELQDALKPACVAQVLYRWYGE